VGERVNDAELKALFSKKLQLLRRHSRKTIEETADFLDLEYAQYYRLLKGYRLPHLVTLFNISRAYGLDLNWWFKELSETERKNVLLKESAAEAKLLRGFSRLDKKAKNFAQKILQDFLRYRAVN
jgi:transcriptional regulator with XRE-family HTH domain